MPAVHFLCLFSIRNVFHNIARLAVKHRTNLIQNINRQMFSRTCTNRRNRRLPYPGFLRQLHLRHFIHSKQDFQTKLNHTSTFFLSPIIPNQSHTFNTKLVNYIRKQKIIFDFKNILYDYQLTIYEFRSIIYLVRNKHQPTKRRTQTMSNPNMESKVR